MDGWRRRSAAWAALLLTLGGLLAGCVGPEEREPEVGKADPKPRFGPFPPVDVAAVEVTDAMVPSFDGTPIAVTIFRPAHATAATPVPVILHANAWAATRWMAVGHEDAYNPIQITANPDMFLEAGFGVASMDQRGHGDSGGQDAWMLPEVHGRDVVALVDHLAHLPWVALDAPGDPVLGAVGFSYGAFVQAIAALYETETTGATRFDALAPFAFPYDFGDALAPNGVPRSVWWDTVVAAGAATGVRMDPMVAQIHAAHTATGSYPDGTGGLPDADAYLRARSPVGFLDRDVRLDVPVLAISGASDTLYTFNQAWRFLDNALTPEAREDSRFAAQRLGHFLPGQPEVVAEPCGAQLGGHVWTLAVAWHRHHLLGERAESLAPFTMATERECLALDRLPEPALTVVPGTGLVQSPATGLGRPLSAVLPIGDGPVTLAGASVLNATVAVAPPGARVFVALAAGPTPTDVRILHDQWTPLEVDGPGSIEGIELAAVATTVEAGETIFLAMARWVDQFAHHHDRVPGPVVLEGIEVGLPVVEGGVA